MAIQWTDIENGEILSSVRAKLNTFNDAVVQETGSNTSGIQANTANINNLTTNMGGKMDVVGGTFTGDVTIAPIDGTTAPSYGLKHFDAPSEWRSEALPVDKYRIVSEVEGEANINHMQIDKDSKLLELTNSNIKYDGVALLPVDGSKPMEGNLDVGDNSLINVGDIELSSGYLLLTDNDIISTNVIVTVGVEFPTLQEAFAWAGNIGYAGGRVSIILPEGVHELDLPFFSSINGVHITIASLYTPVNRNAEIRFVNPTGTPLDDVLFNVMTSGLSFNFIHFSYQNVNSVAFFASTNSNVYYNTCWDEDNGHAMVCHVQDGSTVLLESCDFHNIGISAAWGSSIHIRHGTYRLGVDMIAGYDYMIGFQGDWGNSSINFAGTYTIENTSPNTPTYSVEPGIIDERGNFISEGDKPLISSAVTYEFTKVSAITLTETETLVATLDLTDIPAGTYEQGYSFEVNFGGLKDKSVHFRADVDGVTGTVFDTQSDKNSNHKNRRYSYPKQRTAGAYKMEFYMWKQAGVTQDITLDWCDLTIEYKKGI